MKNTRSRTLRALLLSLLLALVVYNVKVSVNSSEGNAMNLFGLNISTMVNDTFATQASTNWGTTECATIDGRGYCKCMPRDYFWQDLNCHPIGSEIYF